MPKPSASPSAPRSARRSTPRAPAFEPQTQVLHVAFRNGEAVDAHPDLASLLQEGWRVHSAVPRIVESGGIRLLVVLVKPGPGVET